MFDCGVDDASGDEIKSEYIDVMLSKSAWWRAAMIPRFNLKGMDGVECSLAIGDTLKRLLFIGLRWSTTNRVNKNEYYRNSLDAPYSSILGPKANSPFNWTYCRFSHLKNPRP